MLLKGLINGQVYYRIVWVGTVCKWKVDKVLRHLENPMSKRIRFHLSYDSARNKGALAVPDIVEKDIYVQTME